MVNILIPGITSLLVFFLLLFGKLLDRINAELVMHLTSHGLLPDKQNGFHFSSSTADRLSFITDFLYQALDRNVEARVVALDISMVFGGVWHAG